MNYQLKDLKEWDEKILKIVHEVGLDCYPQEFEICDHNDMLGYMAYTGMPSHYPHWSFGKAFERQKTMYKLGVSGLPYEMVINSNPCLAYLMKDNTLLLQILTIAHVYGHNDFFKNNITFANTPANYVIEMFKSHADRVRQYIEDPSIGERAVEEILDAAHALRYQCQRNLRVRKLSLKEQREQALARAQRQYEDYDYLKGRPPYVPPDIHKIPLEPEEDLLLFIRDYNAQLEDWQKDLLTIVAEETRYFLPQIETKIMNEGWASYWHYQILNRLELPQGLHFEFIKRHNQVICPQVGGLNPYHLGFKMFENIFQRWENPDPKDREEFGLTGGEGLKKIFQVRESDRDQSFLRQYLTKELMQELDLFQHEQQGNDRVITKISDEENWKKIRDTLIMNVGMNRVPVIHIIDANYEHQQKLLLRHQYDGRELDLGYAQHTMRYLYRLWSRPVVMETVLKGRNYQLQYDYGDQFEIKEIRQPSSSRWND
ncbi:MAG: SpoVR family protein [bacterium]|nr:SpoVR family protein [bacterium]